MQWHGLFVRLLDPRTGQLLREHLRQKRGAHRIRDQDRPRRTPLHIQQLLARADKAGPSIGALCDSIHQRQAKLGVRRILGVLSLVKKYGCAAADEACTIALELGVPEYRFVRRGRRRLDLRETPVTPAETAACSAAVVEWLCAVQYRDRSKTSNRAPGALAFPGNPATRVFAYQSSAGSDPKPRWRAGRMMMFINSKRI